MRRVILLVPDLFPEDAVGNDVLGMSEALKRARFQVIFVCNHAARGFPFRKPDEASRDYADSENDLLIYHYAVEWPAGDAFFQSFRGVRILRYHNVTPPEFLRPWNQAVADFCRRGRERLKDLTPPFLLLADSDENRRDYASITKHDVPARILPPFHRAETLAATTPDPALSSELRGCAWPKFLHVGRVSPHKNLAALIGDLDRSLYELSHESPPGPFPVRPFFHRLCEHRLRPSHFANAADGPVLYAVGSFSRHFRRYNSLVLKAARDARLLRVRFLSGVREPALAALYRGCDLLVTRSLHEGFFVPIVEAASCGLPMLLPDMPIFHETAGDQAIFTPRITGSELMRGLEAARQKDVLAPNMIAHCHSRFATSALERGLIEAIDSY